MDRITPREFAYNPIFGGVGEEFLKNIVEAALAAKPGQLKCWNVEMVKCSNVQVLISRCSKPYKSNVHPIAGTFIYSSGSPKSWNRL